MSRFPNNGHVIRSNVSDSSVEPVAKGKRVYDSRARSVPHRRPYVGAVCLSAIHYMCVLAAATTFGLYLAHPTPLASKLFIGFLLLALASWLLAFFKRRHTHCPLCKGTPLINSGALAHQKAFRIFPLNHGVTAILSIIATQKFRCLYCGTEFDLLKMPSHQVSNGVNKYKGDYTAYNTYTTDEKP